MAPPKKKQSSKFEYEDLVTTLKTLLGEKAYKNLKDSPSYKDWRVELIKGLSYLQKSAHKTIHVYDKPWLVEFNLTIQEGIDVIGKTDCINQQIATFSSTLFKLSFHQLGLIPDNRTKKNTVRPSSLNTFREVQYVQSHEQKENYYWSSTLKGVKEVGSRKLICAHNHHRQSKTKIPFSEWYEKEKSKS